MAPLGPFGPARRVLVGVSGGADSLALAWLLRRWGAPLGIVVDHGLRAGSAIEAASAVETLAGFGVPAQVLCVSIPLGGGLGERARAARYGALLGACERLGYPDLLVAHHAQDQAETVVLRGGEGAWAMPPIGYRAEARVLRPMLGVAPARLRATLCAAGLAWAEDPGNRDPASARGALRVGSLPVEALCDRAAAAGRARVAAERAVAEELASSVFLFPTGHAAIVNQLSPPALSALLWTVSGRAHPPRRADVAALAARGQGTLHGVAVDAGLAWREPDALAAPVAAQAGALWDGRFRVGSHHAGASVGALGADAGRLRRRPGLPARVLHGLPALRCGTELLDVPHLPYARGEPCLTVAFSPGRPLGPAVFPAHGATGEATGGLTAA